MAIPIKVRCSSGEKYSIEVELSMTILETKQKLVDVTSVPVERQRLIYKGKVLKDPETLESYGVKKDHTIHFVKGAAPPASTPPPPPSQPVSSVPPPLAFGNSPTQPAAATYERMQREMQAQMMQRPEMMQEMMNSPMVQNMMNNPEIIRNMMQSNPAMRQVLESNPQLNHVLNDPELLRQSMEAARNPAAMREMMRNQDTAMRNVESHPEGFNALRRMYQDVQEPLMNAAGSNISPPGSSFPMPGGTNSTTETTPTPSATTNPWATPNANSNPLGNIDPSMISQILSNPMIQQQMETQLRDPNFLQRMQQMDPNLRAAMDSNPQMRSMLENPETIRAMMNPQNIQAILQLQAATQQLSQTGLMSGAGQTNPAQPGVDFSQMMSMMGGLPPAAPTPTGDPEELYASQITQLNEMGFTNREQNVRALTQTMGNVNAAVERILGGLA